MSDQSQGTDWWQASDGKWYPPETHPDYVAPAPPPPPAPPAPPAPTAPPVVQRPLSPQAPPAVPGPQYGAPPPVASPPSLPRPSTTPGGPSTGPFAGKSTAQLIVLGCAAVIAVSCFLPWVRVSFLGTYTAAGTDEGGDGWLFLGGAAVLAVLAWLKPVSWPVLGVSVLGAAGWLYERHEIGTAKGIGISIGMGLWLILLACLVAGGTAVHETSPAPPGPPESGLLPVAQRYKVGVAILAVLLVSGLVYGQKEHDLGDNGGGLSVDLGDDASGGFGLDESSAPDPADCKAGGPTTLTKDVTELASYYSGLSGDITVDLLAARELPTSFHDGFVDETITAQGKFIGVQVRVTNDADQEIQPSSLFDDWRLTDGRASWETADYTAGHQGGVSAAWADSQGDEQPATQIQAGFDGTTWAVFDIPTDAAQRAISVINDDKQTCLGLP